MIIRTPRATIDAYYAHEAINQSALKVIISQGIQSFQADRLAILTGKDEQYEEKAHFVIGNGVDVEMTEGSEQYAIDHYISTLEKKPSDTLKAVLHIVLSTLISNNIDPRGMPLSEYKDALHFGLNNVVGKDSEGKETRGYFMNRAKANYHEDTRIEGVLKDPINTDYWYDITNAVGKRVLSSTEDMCIKSMCQTLRDHPHTLLEFLDRPNVITVYQYPIYCVINGVACKMLVDKIDIYLDKRIIKPQDIKTMRGYTLKFPESVRARRYDFQGSFYTDGLLQDLVNLSAHIGHDVTDFTVEPFEFIVESTTNGGCPIVYSLSEDLLNIGRNGLDRIPGYIDALREYNFWLGNDFDAQTALAPLGGRLVISGDYKHHLV